MKSLSTFGVLLAIGCGSGADPAPHITVEERWPDGSAMKQVEISASGETVKRWFHENGNPDRLEQYDVEGRKTGMWGAWHPSGEPWSEHHYREGIQVDAYRTWHANGNPFIVGAYNKSGEPTGTWQFFGPDGTLMKEMTGAEIASTQAGGHSNPH